MKRLKCVLGRYLQSGEWDFSKLPNLYVIMILPYDPFGKGYMMYRIQSMCREVPELDYPDGLMYIYFNTRGIKGGSPDILELLEDYGEIPERLRARIEAETEPEVLARWHKLAARCGSLSAFEEQMPEV